MAKRYNHRPIESKWQKVWQSKKTFEVKNKKGKKKFVLIEFPYPSGAGLHVGHIRPYLAGDVTAKYFKLRGFNTMYPIGWDAFGLPAENYAIKNKVHPSVSTAKNVTNAKKQIHSWGIGFDWSREINTTDSAYYKWTQWLFLQFLKKGLAYEATGLINWCPKDKTGLANEEVVEGKCERCGTIVEKKELRQWYLKITAYAEKLLEGLKDLPWPEHIKLQQENWIGKSEGAEVEFKIVENNFTKETSIKVYTTRIDTIFSGTFLVLAPEHPLIQEIINSKSEILNKSEIQKYLNECANKTEIERTDKNNKTGVEIKGIEVINPATNEKIPVWVSDFVLGHYGTGAVFADAHDERDFDMAKKYNIPLKTSIEPLFIQKSGVDAVRSDLPFDEREAVVAIVKHWAEDKYLCLAWKKTNWKGFVMGGVENGENPIQAAIREIKEETGYKNIQLSKELPGLVHSKFYHPIKNINRFGHFPSFVFTLQNGEQDEISDEEKEIHSIHWVEKDKVLDFLNVDDIKFIWNKYLNPRPFTGEGILYNSAQFDGLTSAEARPKIISWLEEKGLAKRKLNYRLRDWVFSRQRYWGEPIPVIHCEKCGVVPVPEKDLPVKLPNVKKYEPTGTGQSPLAGIDKWVNVKCPKCKGKSKRETNTMPQWAGSSWYWLRYADPKNKKQFADKKMLKYWTPVDYYFGGLEHTTLHLLYSRFWNQFLYDQKLVTTKEPYVERVPHGIILGPDGEKMSKSRGNVVNPDDIVKTFGADTMRVYMAFLGPHEAEVAWNDKGIIGSRRFLERVWNLTEFISKKESADVTQVIHKTIDKISKDIESHSFNTAISALMICVNSIYESKAITQKSLSKFLILLSPFAPHLSEEIWHTLGNKKSIYLSKWPKADPKILASEKITIAVQVNGKTRAILCVPKESTDEDVAILAKKMDGVKAHLEGKEIVKTIVVKGKIVNFVAK